MNAEAKRLIASLGLDIDPRTRMGALPVGLQQLVELSRVLFSGARILILDEPTSALSPPEVARLFGVLRRLRDEGRSVVFISHFLDDVLEISDRVTVFRNGHKVITEDAARLDKDAVIGHMIGRRIGRHAHGRGRRSLRRRQPPGGARRCAKAASGARSTASRSACARARSPASTASWAAARSSSRARCSASCRCASGEITARRQGPSGCARPRRRGGPAIAFLPENRRMMLFRTEPVYKNVSIAILGRIGRILLQPAREREIAAEPCQRTCRSARRQPGVLLGSLSGGNQQKVALAKWLTYLPKVLILAEPTRGMDVGAKEDVIRILKSLRDRGVAILVLSTEPETILTLADRVTVMKKGAVDARVRHAGGSRNPTFSRPPDPQRIGSQIPLDSSDSLRHTAPARLRAFLADQLAQHRAGLHPARAGDVLLGASPSFLTVANGMNILSQVSITGIIAVGLTFVILTAEIDLSVAAIANVIGITVAYFTLQPDYVNIANIPLPGAIAVALTLLERPGVRLPDRVRRDPDRHPVLHHDAGGDADRQRRLGAAGARADRLFLSGDRRPISARRSIFGIRWTIIVCLIFLAVAHFVLTYTRFGRYVYMVGGNREAAEYSGVNVRAIIASVMIISAMCSGVAGMLGVAYFGSAQQNQFDTFLLDAIAAVVVGGTSLFGGRGGIGNTIVGLLVLGVLNNGLDHIQIDSFLKILIRGLILLIALIVNVYAQVLRETGPQTD